MIINKAWKELQSSYASYTYIYCIIFLYNVCYKILYAVYCIVVKSSLYFKKPETYKPYSMARTKQTPRYPNIDRPVAAVGSDIQSTERRPTPRPTQGKVSSKEGKQP